MIFLFVVEGEVGMPRMKYASYFGMMFQFKNKQN